VCVCVFECVCVCACVYVYVCVNPKLELQTALVPGVDGGAELVALCTWERPEGLQVVGPPPYYSQA